MLVSMPSPLTDAARSAFAPRSRSSSRARYHLAFLLELFNDGAEGRAPSGGAVAEEQQGLAGAARGEIVGCRTCPAWWRGGRRVAREEAAHRDRETYWGRPVPG